jgi:hypothetical protein
VVEEPLDGRQEGDVLRALVSSFNENLGLKLAPFTSLECGVMMQEKDTAENRHLVIGGSHMSRMVSFMPYNTINLTELFFAAEPSSCGKVSQVVTELCLGLGDTVVMDLLSNFAFFGTDGERMPHPPPPPLKAKKMLQNCNTFAERLGERWLIPIECMNQDHMENYHNLNMKRKF